MRPGSRPRMCGGALALLVWLALHADAGRIVGGEQASIADFPFLASLQRRRGGHCCVANLVTVRWLLTAAHCVHHGCSSQPADFVIVAGATNITDVQHQKEGQRGWPDRIVVHPLFCAGGTYDYDLALIRLGSPLVEGPLVRPVVLPLDMVPNSLLGNAVCVVAGWGTTEKVDAWVRRSLMKVELPLMNPHICSQQLMSELREFVHLCTHAVAKDACHGDSGAALMCQGQQVGVVSWGFGCANAYPGVYARVDTQLGWIRQVVDDAASRVSTLPALCSVCPLLATMFCLT